MAKTAHQPNDPIHLDGAVWMKVDDENLHVAVLVRSCDASSLREEGHTKRARWCDY